jgi:hypothetical protein
MARVSTGCLDLSQARNRRLSGGLVFVMAVSRWNSSPVGLLPRSVISDNPRVRDPFGQGISIPDLSEDIASEREVPLARNAASIFQ